MQKKNLSLLSVAALVILAVLLFSWVQYGGEEPQEEAVRPITGIEGEWEISYTYGHSGFGDVFPASIEVTIDGSIITVTGEGSESSGEFLIVSPSEAIEMGGINQRMYVSEGALYIYSLNASGVSYAAYTMSGTMIFPNAGEELSGAVFPMDIKLDRGLDVEELQVDVVVDNVFAFVASGRIIADDAEVSFSGFIKTDRSTFILDIVLEDVPGIGVLAVDVDGEAILSYAGYSVTISGGSVSSVPVLSGEYVLTDGTYDSVIELKHDGAFTSIFWDDNSFTAVEAPVLGGTTSLIAFAGGICVIMQDIDDPHVLHLLIDQGAIV